MTDSMIILGPQGCGKTRNAAILAKAYGFDKWCEADDGMPATGYLIFANHVDPECELRVVNYEDAWDSVR